MKPVRLRFQASAPSKAPKRLQKLYFSASGTKQFQIEVSAKNGVDMFGFYFAGTPVPMSHNRGLFNGQIGRKGLLEWVMIWAARRFDESHRLRRRQGGGRAEGLDDPAATRGGL